MVCYMGSNKLREELDRFRRMRDSGVLTQDEYERLKAKAEVERQKVEYEEHPNWNHPWLWLGISLLVVIVAILIGASIMMSSWCTGPC